MAKPEETGQREHHDFLRKIGNEVYELVRDRAKMARFRSMVKIFCEKNEAHQEELERVKTAAKADSKLRAATKRVEKEKWGKTWDAMTDNEKRQICLDEIAKKPPEGYEGYMWYGGLWISPPKTPDLFFYLTPLFEFNYMPRSEQKWWELLKPSNDDERLVCCYALVTAIHDSEVLEKPVYTNQVYNGSWRLRDKWIGELRRKCNYNDFFADIVTDDEPNKDTRAWIERALADVKADLAATFDVDSMIPLPETEQKVTAGKKPKSKKYSDDQLKRTQNLDGHEDLLRKIAMDVFSLVSTPDNRAYFRKQVEAFACKLEELQTELDQIKKDYEVNWELKEAVRELDKRIENADEEPDLLELLECCQGKGFLKNFKDHILYDRGDYWGPPAQTPDLMYYLTHFPGLPFDDIKNKRLPNESEKLICSYTLLAVIHDYYVQEDPIFFEPLFFNRDNWPAIIWRRIKRCDKDIKDTQAWIQRAFAHVKADLVRVRQGPKITTCTEDEFLQFKSIYEGFCFLIDNQDNSLNSVYSYRQTEVFEKMKDFWPRFETIRQRLSISLEFDLNQFREAIFGIELPDGASESDICVSGQDWGLPAGYILDSEKQRLRKLVKQNLDSLMFRLNSYFQNGIKAGTGPETKVAKEPKGEKCGPKTKSDKYILIGALYKLHGLGTDKVRYEPVASKEIERETGWNQPKVHREMKELFGEKPMQKYKQCFGVRRLTSFMKKLKDGTFEVDAIVEPDQE